MLLCVIELEFVIIIGIDNVLGMQHHILWSMIISKTYLINTRKHQASIVKHRPKDAYITIFLTH